MAPDPYAPCPCGSGKKLKFCCQEIIGDIEKAERLIDGGQVALGIQILDSLRKSHRGNPLILTQRAALHLEADEWREAKGALEELLHAHPDHAEANVMYAYACLVVDGYEASRPALQRAFQRAAGHPALVAAIAGALTEEMLGRHRYLAGREFLMLSLKWSSDDVKQRAFLSLLHLDGERNIPYPLRGPHNLQSWSGTDEENKEFAKALRLSSITCWDSAARHFQHLADKHPDAAALWHNLGLSRACMGDEIEAARHFHTAAKCDQPRPFAIECETIAQLLDIQSGENRDRLQGRRFEVGSVAKLLTRLSQNDRFVGSTNTEDPDKDEPLMVAARYEILSGPAPRVEDVSPERARELPVTRGWLIVYDGNPDMEVRPQALLSAFQSRYGEVEAFVLEAAGGEIRPSEGAEPRATDVGLAEPFRTLEERPHVPDEVPLRTRREVYRRFWEHNVREVWANAPNPGLGGRTPREAIGVPELAIPLTAALIVLDAYSDIWDQVIDLPALFEEYGVAPLEPIHLTAETPVQALSSLQMHRLVVSELSDDQLRFVVNREMLSHQPRFLYEVLVEALNRPGCRKQLDLDRCYSTLVTLCRQRGRRDEAFQWLRQAIDHYKSQSGSFEAVFKWESMEISLHADDPNDPELQPLLRRYYAQYGRKIPNLDRILEAVFVQLGVELPPGVIPSGDHEAGGSTTPGGIWTPDSTAEAGSGKKLILPGQF